MIRTKWYVSAPRNLRIDLPHVSAIGRQCALILGLTVTTLAADMANAAEKKLDGDGIKATLNGAAPSLRTIAEVGISVR